MNYRNKKLLKAAKDQPCAHCGSLAGVVAAHSNSSKHGKGVGLKSHDIFIADLCFSCHNRYDGRCRRLDIIGQDEFERAMVKTIVNRLQREIIK